MSIDDFIIASVRWVGWAAITGMMAAIAVGAWWYVLSQVLKNMKETWWIATWALWKRGHGGLAKEALRKAINADKILADKTADPAEKERVRRQQEAQ
jgi:hypothetical protein